jgi:hypothetical protein
LYLEYVMETYIFKICKHFPLCFVFVLFINGLRCLEMEPKKVSKFEGLENINGISY